MPDEFDRDLVARLGELDDGFEREPIHPCDYHEHDGVEEGTDGKKVAKKPSVSWASIL